MEWPRIESLLCRIRDETEGVPDMSCEIVHGLAIETLQLGPKLEARLEAAELLAEEVRRAPCRDDQGHTRCLRCAALAAWEACK